MATDGATTAAAGDIAAVHPIAADTVVDIEADLLRVHSPAADTVAVWPVADSTVERVAASTAAWPVVDFTVVAEADFTGVAVTAKTGIERRVRS
jgi:hypothetical protein